MTDGTDRERRRERGERVSKGEGSRAEEQSARAVKLDASCQQVPITAKPPNLFFSLFVTHSSVECGKRSRGGMRDYRDRDRDRKKRPTSYFTDSYL